MPTNTVGDIVAWNRLPCPLDLHSYGLLVPHYVGPFQGQDQVLIEIPYYDTVSCASGCSGCLLQHSFGRTQHGEKPMEDAGTWAVLVRQIAGTAGIRS